MSQNILITGCLGFIGFHTALKLSKNKKSSVFGVDNINNYYDVELKKSRLKILEKYKNFNFKKIDIRSESRLKDFFKKNNIKYVIHLAAQAGVRNSIDDPKSYLDNNVIGFFNILEICKELKIKHLIYASTSSVYGDSKKFPSSENDNTDFPVSFYAATKKSNEIMAYSYSNIFKVPSTGLRFFTVYGPYGRPDMALFKFTKLISDSKKIPLFNKGDHVRDFTYIDDIVEGIVLLIKKPPRKKIPYEIYNLGSGNPKSLKYFLKNIEKNLNKKAALNLKSMQVGDVHKTHADIKKINKAYSYEPKFDIPTGIENFIKWYKKYFKKNYE